MDSFPVGGVGREVDGDPCIVAGVGLVNLTRRYARHKNVFNPGWLLRREGKARVRVTPWKPRNLKQKQNGLGSKDSPGFFAV